MKIMCLHVMRHQWFRFLRFWLRDENLDLSVINLLGSEFGVEGCREEDVVLSLDMDFFGMPLWSVSRKGVLKQVSGDIGLPAYLYYFLCVVDPTRGYQISATI